MRCLPFLLIAVLCSSADAHLQLYRQGQESAGIARPGDHFGQAVISGDFNGDGYDDIAAGAPDNSGFTPPFGVGSVMINYGSYFGITHEGAVEIEPADAGGSSAASMDFGYALAVADFDNDGFDDLVIGAPGSPAGLAVVDGGEVFIMRGSAAGLIAWKQYDQTDAGLAVETGDRFGSSLAVGDFDLDAQGYVDLMVGSPGENSSAGIIVEFLSSGGSPGSGGSAWFDEAVLGGVNAAGNRFGAAMAVGDLVRTAAPDLAVGAPGYDIINLAVVLDVGRVWVIPGIIGNGINQINATAYDADDVDSVEAHAKFGSSLAVGNFQDAGGYASLAVGEPSRTVNGTAFEGRVLVFPGGATSLDTTAPDVIDAFYFGDSMVAAEVFGGALAAGSFDVADAYDDLAIGSYNDAALPGPIQSGQVFMAYGGSTGFDGTPGTEFWDQYDLNEQPTAGDGLGYSVCFGAFDATNKGGIAAGAPYERGNTGMVYVIAPWRQEYGLGSQRALVVDCDDNWVYSLKPFDRSWIASITKIMTVLIAVERMQLAPSDPLYFNPGDQYIATGWESTVIPGSKYHFGLNERISNWDMLYACLLRSGNDAAFAIANAASSFPLGYAVRVSIFVDAMNAKAAALGMNGTHFHNPAGLDTDPLGVSPGGHYSTLADYVKLCRAAMDDPFFALIAGTVSHPITRHLMIGSTPVDIPWNINNIYAGVLNNMTTPMNGIKGGSTTCAQATGCFSAIDPGGNGMAIVNTFYTPFTISDAVYTPDAARLMQLGLAACGSELTINPTTAFRNPIHMPSTFTGFGSLRGMSFELLDKTSGDVVVSGYRNDAGADDAHAELQVSRFSELQLVPQEVVELGSAPFERHNGLCLTNMSSDVVDLMMTPSYGTESVISLAPTEKFTLPAYDSGAFLPDVMFELRNLSSTDSVIIAVDEFYAFDATFPASASMWNARIKRNGSIINDGVELIFEGQDSAASGGDVSMTTSDSDEIVGIPIGPGTLPQSSALSLLPAAPNPFSGRTALSFDLARSGSVDLRIYDTRGRQVRGFGEMRLNPGRWTVPWDGRDQNATSVSGGVYFYKVWLDGEGVGSGKLSLLR